MEEAKGSTQKRSTSTITPASNNKKFLTKMEVPKKEEESTS
jgi:hypothetical protein